VQRCMIPSSLTSFSQRLNLHFTHTSTAIRALAVVSSANYRGAGGTTMFNAIAVLACWLFTGHRGTVSTAPYPGLGKFKC
jgi:hypothetical protein